jgi:hypothetical protein
LQGKSVFPVLGQLRSIGVDQLIPGFRWLIETGFLEHVLVVIEEARIVVEWGTVDFALPGPEGV